MAATIAYTERPANTFWTIAELNTFFTDLEIMLNQKLDIRGGVLYADLLFTLGGGLINMADPSVSLAGEVIPRGDA